jgi:hypothetical protein
LLSLRHQVPQQVEFIPEFARDGLRVVYGDYEGSFEEAMAAQADLPESPSRPEATDASPPAETSPMSEDAGATS